MFCNEYALFLGTLKIAFYCFKMNKNLVKNANIVDYGNTKEKEIYQIIFDLTVNLEWKK